MSAMVSQALFLVLVFSVLPIAIASVCGGIVAMLQAITQIQEQSFTFLVKFCSISVVIYLCFDIFSAQMLDFFRQSLSSIAFVRG